MTRRHFLGWAGLLLLLACRSASAPEAAASSTAASDAQALTVLGEYVVSSWQPAAGGADLVIAKPVVVRRGSDNAPPRFVLMPNETLAFVDKHVHVDFTLREVTDAGLVFDYATTHRPPSGEVERFAGRVTLPPKPTP